MDCLTRMGTSRERGQLTRNQPKILSLNAKQIMRLTSNRRIQFKSRDRTLGIQEKKKKLAYENNCHFRQDSVITKEKLKTIDNQTIDNQTTTRIPENIRKQSRLVELMGLVKNQEKFSILRAVEERLHCN